MKDWNYHQQWEKDWWGNCCNTYNEETKQYTYAKYIGLDEFKTNNWQIIGWDFKNKSVIDFGGGPTSILLKSKAKKRTVVDPCNYPEWVKQRYEYSGIHYISLATENYLSEEKYDIALSYNVLQHVINPELAIKNMLKSAKEVRVFDWLDVGVHDGHPHDLKKDLLNKWLGGNGQTHYFNDGICYGTGYFGIFLGV